MSSIMAILTKTRITPADALEWAFLSDRVMGGISEGSASLGGCAVRLSGRVSTANRGGFIQVRTELPRGLPDTVEGLVLKAKGMPGRYYVHLRTARDRRPWQFHQASFEVGEDWREVRIPFRDFEARGGAANGVAPGEVRFVGLVAWGRDHDADVALSGIGLY